MKTSDKVCTRPVSGTTRLLRAILCLTSMTLILAATAVAAEKGTPNSESGKKKKAVAESKAKKSAPQQDAQESKQVITGSYIPETKTKRQGPVPETTSPVYVIDRKAIEQTGATSVSQVLRRRVTSTR